MSIDTKNPEPPKHTLRTGVAVKRIIDLENLAKGYPKGTTVKEVVDPILEVKGVKIEKVELEKPKP